MKKNKKIKILILCILICFSMITITICISNNIKKKIFLKDINSNISNENFKSFRISEEDYCINVTSTLIYKAIWERKKYKLVFDFNGGRYTGEYDGRISYNT